MNQVVYPKPLAVGSKVAVTAFSSGVPKACHPRLNIVLTHLQAQGFEVLEGQCLKYNREHVSAPAQQRAHDLMTFLCDDRIGAIAPPWGGELAMEVLPLLDFERLKLAKPKWLFGFSDISTLGMVLMSKLGWSSAHCTNLMQLHPSEAEPLTVKTLQHLAKAEQGYTFTQTSSEYYQIDGESFADNPNTVLNVTEQTCWKTLPELGKVTMSGRLIGGCFDTLQYLLGTPYFDLMTLKQRFAPEGIILYFENAELSPTAFKRALLSLKFKGVFEQINGLLIGRNAVIGHADKEIASEKVLLDVISKLDIPVIYDVDIGHLPPNLTLFNGAYAHVCAHNGVGYITQTLK